MRSSKVFDINLSKVYFIFLTLILQWLAAFSNDLQFDNYKSILQVRNNLAPFTVIFPFKNVSHDTITPTITVHEDGVVTRCNPSVIFPQKSGNIIVDIGYQGVPGKKNFAVIITCKDQFDTLYIPCIFTPPFKLDPPETPVFKFFHGDTISFTTIVSWKKAQASLVKIDSSRLKSDFPKVKIDSIKGGFTITADILQNGAYGLINDTIPIVTHQPDWPYLFIPIRGTCERFLFPEPDSINFGKISSRTRNWKVITLHSKQIKYQIERAEITIPFIMVSIGRHPNKDWELVTTIYPNSPKGPFAGEIRIFLPGCAEPEQVIPVRGEIY